jgi:hypothetical protein
MVKQQMTRPHELLCEHRIGHSQGVHACDGCCEAILLYQTADLGARYRYRREGAQLERQRIIELIENAYVDSYRDEIGSLVWTDDIIALIQENQNTSLQENPDE